MEINGVAHIILTVRSIEASRGFYVALLERMGLTRIFDTPANLYYVGGRTAVGLRPADPAHAAEPFTQGRCGLHHVCFRARSRDDVDALHATAVELGATIVHPPRDEPWAPGYYSVLFEDPDGIRIEINHVPGKGLLDPGVPRTPSA
jgi:catechol 2,3-dioxygenase-like lactoylglutathione lyase family enzyme